METIVERRAALDVHRAQVTACARAPDGRGGREQHVAEFASTVRGLLALRDWLVGHGVTQVVMEATGVYWKAPLCSRLTSRTPFLDLRLAVAREVARRVRDVGLAARDLL